MVDSGVTAMDKRWNGPSAGGRRTWGRRKACAQEEVPAGGWSSIAHPWNNTPRPPRLGSKVDFGGVWWPLEQIHADWAARAPIQCVDPSICKLGPSSCLVSRPPKDSQQGRFLTPDHQGSPWLSFQVIDSCFTSRRYLWHIAIECITVDSHWGILVFPRNTCINNTTCKLSSFYIHPRASYYRDSYLLKLQNYFEETSDFLCKTTEDMSLPELGSASPTTERFPQMKSLWNRVLSSLTKLSLVPALWASDATPLYISESHSHSDPRRQGQEWLLHFSPRVKRWKTGLPTGKSALYNFSQIILYFSQCQYLISQA